MSLPLGRNALSYVTEAEPHPGCDDHDNDKQWMIQQLDSPLPCRRRCPFPSGRQSPHTGHKALFRDNPMHTDIVRRLGHARHDLYTKCQATPVRCSRQPTQETIIVTFAESQPPSTRVKSDAGDYDVTNLFRRDHDLGPIRFKDTKTTTPKLRRVVWQFYRCQTVPVHHRYRDALLP